MPKDPQVLSDAGFTVPEKLVELGGGVFLVMEVELVLPKAKGSETVCAGGGFVVVAGAEVVAQGSERRSNVFPPVVEDVVSQGLLVNEEVGRGFCCCCEGIGDGVRFVVVGVMELNSVIGLCVVVDDVVVVVGIGAGDLFDKLNVGA